MRADWTTAWDFARRGARTHRARTLALLLLTLLLGGALTEAGERTPRARGVKQHLLGKGTSWETPWYERNSGRAGPTVFLTGGIHGNEPAGAYAAEQIRHWPLKRGRLIVLPRANPAALRAFKRRTPGVTRSLGDLNRNFPRAGKREPARGVRAKAIWALAKRLKPDWVVDLHEGFDFHRKNAKSVGSTVIAPKSDEGRAAARLMLRAVNKTITSEGRHFSLIQTAVDTSLGRAAVEHLDAVGLICETTSTQSRSLRARQHRILVHQLLSHLQMIDPELPVDTVLDREALDGRTAIALYDAGGAAGRGVPRIWAHLRRNKQLYVHRIGPAGIRMGALDQFDVVIFAGGSGSAQARALKQAGRSKVAAFIKGGGGYVGVCAGAYLACTSFSWGLKVLDAKTVSRKWRRGRGTLKVEFTERGREIFDPEEDVISLLYNNGPILAPAGDDNLPDYEILALFREEVAENGTPEGAQVDTPAIVMGTHGEGRVLVFSPHPEQTKGFASLVERSVTFVARGARTPAKQD